MKQFSSPCSLSPYKPELDFFLNKLRREFRSLVFLPSWEDKGLVVAEFCKLALALGYSVQVLHRGEQFCQSFAQAMQAFRAFQAKEPQAPSLLEQQGDSLKIKRLRAFCQTELEELEAAFQNLPEQSLRRKVPQKGLGLEKLAEPKKERRAFLALLAEAKQMYANLRFETTALLCISQKLYQKPSASLAQAQVQRSLSALLPALKEARQETLSCIQRYESQLDEYLTILTDEANKYIDALLENIAPWAQSKELNSFPSIYAKPKTAEEQAYLLLQQEALKDYRTLLRWHRNIEDFDFQLPSISDIFHGGFAAMQKALLEYQSKILQAFGNKESFIAPYMAHISPLSLHPKFSRLEYIRDIFLGFEEFSENLAQSPVFSALRFRSQNLREHIEELDLWIGQLQEIEQILNRGDFLYWYEWQYLLLQCSEEELLWIEQLRLQAPEGNWSSLAEVELQGREEQKLPSALRCQALIEEIELLRKELREQVSRRWPAGKIAWAHWQEPQALEAGYDICILGPGFEQAQGLQAKLCLCLFGQEQGFAKDMPQAPEKLPPLYRALITEKAPAQYRYKSFWQGLFWPLLFVDEQGEVLAAVGQRHFFWSFISKDAAALYWDLALSQKAKELNISLIAP